MHTSQKGFTLVELLITISIAAILAALAAPSFSTFVAKQRVSSSASEVFSALNLARMEAIKRNRHVLVCPINIAGTDCLTGNNWTQGWLVCVDADSDGTCDTITNASDPNYPNPFAKHSALTGDSTVTGTVNPVVFKPDGSSAAVTLTVASGATGVTPKTVTVATSGYVSNH
jgi:type IV fimbrial biogenesis protein FimT